MAKLGTGTFGVGGTLLVLCFFVYEAAGWSGGAAAVEGALLIAGLVLAALGIWRIFHSSIPGRKVPPSKRDGGEAGPAEPKSQVTLL